MGDQDVVTYVPDDVVWVQLVNNVWWPGKVVEECKVPDVLKDFFMAKKKKCIAIVFFAGDKSYEFVQNPEKICLYSCPRKMEFVERGHAIYTKQKKKGIVGRSFDMNIFVNDVIKIENDLGGNINIFKPYEINEIKETKDRLLRQSIKNLFITSKEQSKQLLSKTPGSSKKRGKTSYSSTHTPNHTLLHTTPNTTYKCNMKDGCNFTTTRSAHLKKHTMMHKQEDDEQEVGIFKTIKSANTKRTNLFPKDCSTSSCPSPKKRKNIVPPINSLYENTELDEILMSWESPDEDMTDLILPQKRDHPVSEIGESSTSNKIFDENSVGETNLISNSEILEVLCDSSRVIKMSIENTQQTENSEIVDDNVNELNVDDKSDKLIEIDGNKLKKFVEEQNILQEPFNVINMSEEKSQQTENNEIVDDSVNESNMECSFNNILERTGETLDDEADKLIEINANESNKFVEGKNILQELFNIINIPGEKTQQIENNEIVYDGVIESNGECSSNNVLGETEETLDDKSDKLIEIHENESNKFLEEKNILQEPFSVVNMSRKITQRTENSKIVDDALENEETLDKKLEKLKESLSDSSSRRVINISIGGTIYNKESIEGDSTIVEDGSKDNQLKLSSTVGDPTEQSQNICIMDQGTVPLSKLIDEYDTPEWKVFAKDIDEEVRRFNTIPSPQSYLKKLMDEERDSLLHPTISPIEEFNLVDFEIRPPGPPKGYKRIEVFAPYEDDALTEEQAANHPVMRKVKKYIKNGEHDKVKVILKCKHLRNLS